MPFAKYKPKAVNKPLNYTIIDQRNIISVNIRYSDLTQTVWGQELLLTQRKQTVSDRGKQSDLQEKYINERVKYLYYK